MKVLSRPVIWLVRPYISDFSAYDHFSQPLGFLRIANILRKLGFQVVYLDCLQSGRHEMNNQLRTGSDGTGEYQSEKICKPSIFRDVPRYYKRYGIALDVFETLLSSQPDPCAVLVTTGMTYWYPGIEWTLQVIHRIHPRVPVIMGGVYTTLCPDDANRRFFACQQIKGRVTPRFFKTLCELGGLKYPEENSDWTAPPAWDLVPNMRYGLVETQSGCSHRCDYCAVNRITGDPFIHSSERVMADIEQILALGIQIIALYDDDIGCSGARHLESVLRLLSGKRYPITWYLPNALGIKAVTPETSGMLYRCGFRQLRLSINHINRVLGPCGFDAKTVKQIQRASRLLHKEGFSHADISAYLLAGLPDQKLSWLQQAGNQLIECGIRPYMALFSPIPGTIMGDKRLEQLGFNTLFPEMLLTNKILSVYCHPGWHWKAYHELMSEWRDLTDELHHNFNRRIA
jgi:Radical SAM superfamily